MQLQAKKVGDSLHYSSRGAPWPHERAGERERGQENEEKNSLGFTERMRKYCIGGAQRIAIG